MNAEPDGVVDTPPTSGMPTTAVRRTDWVSRTIQLLWSSGALIALTLMACIVLVPFGYMMVISMKRPAEVGNGQMLPQSLIALTSADWKNQSLFECSLNDEQVVLLNEKGSRLALFSPAAPRFEQIARILDLDRPTIRSKTYDVLLTASDPGLELRAQSTVTLTLRPPGDTYRRFGAVILHQFRDSLRSFAPDAILLIASSSPEWIIKATADSYVSLRQSALEQRSELRNMLRRLQSTSVSVTARPVEHTYRRLTKLMMFNYLELLNWDKARAGQWLQWLMVGYPRWFINSLFIAFTAVVLGLFFDSLAAFAFAKFRFPGRDFLFVILVGTLMIPYPVTLVPTFFIYARLGLYDTYAALIIPGMASAFGIFLVRQYMQTIPDELLDAGRVDGAGDFLLYRHVVLPLSRPVLAALAVFRFIFQWNSYLYPLVFTNSDSMKMLQLGLATMEDGHGTTDYGMLMAGAALAVVPILAVYAVMQKHFISGITLGGVKG